ncbi:MAG TPA: TIGR04076 family protein [Syntrophales bacterium]|nr:TIGR04076 family protein [Syntrophales bacterium]HPQ44501.1 TIGR04076 family protein [Syntrophales bacterium]
MKIEPSKNVKIEVIRSECDVMKNGDSVYLNGPILDGKKSGPVCVTALLSIYPWIMSARFGIESDHLGWKDGYKVCCPDGLVEFRVTFLDKEDGNQ